MPIVQATGIAVGNHFGTSATKATRLEEAMLDAVRRCQAEGISDVEMIQTMIRDARQAVLDAE